MKFLAISTNTGDTRPHLAAEGAQVDDLVRRGVVLSVLVKADWSGAVLVLDVADEQAAWATVQALPIAAHGLTQFTLTHVLDPSDLAPTEAAPDQA